MAKQMCRRRNANADRRREDLAELQIYRAGWTLKEGGVRLQEVGTAGWEVQLSDSFTRTPPAMEHTAVPRISIEFARPSKEKVVHNGSIL